jgi:hypothetical protein
MQHVNLAHENIIVNKVKVDLNLQASTFEIIL